MSEKQSYSRTEWCDGRAFEQMMKKGHSLEKIAFITGLTPAEVKYRISVSHEDLVGEKAR